MNGRIDWDAIYGVRAQTEYTDAQVKAATAAVNALPGGNKIPTPWERANDLPDIDALDLEGTTVASVKIADLLASDKKIKRDKLLWHVQNPGKRRNPLPLMANPMVASTDEGNVIVDGHHFLFAQRLLGKTNANVFLVPTK